MCRGSARFRMCRRSTRRAREVQCVTSRGSLRWFSPSFSQRVPCPAG
ncbi:hypothetical protein GFS60_00621 [Rhodococcus sp. WAY2]|nr:hypothetical protein GFS60_00621 [Rhodococcus sp. WAY2]